MNAYEVNKVNVSLIPARGGSKEIPKKNIVPFIQKPLIAHSIELSINCPLVDITFVSTNCKEIADISREYGAIVPFMRPDVISQDLSPDIETFEHFINFIENNLEYKSKKFINNNLFNKLFQLICKILPPTSKCEIIHTDLTNIVFKFYNGFEIKIENEERIVFTYKELEVLCESSSEVELKSTLNTFYKKFPKEFFIVENLKLEDINMIIHLRATYPLRSQELLQDCIQTFDKNKDYDSLRTVIKFDKSPFKMYTISSENTESDSNSSNLTPLFEVLFSNDKGIIKEPYNQCRQLLPQVYLHNGCIDIVRTNTITYLHSMTGNKIYPYVMDENKLLDIDTVADLTLNEKIHQCK
jgi:CMP-N-acetylneuraminic acid synthetase